MRIDSIPPVFHRDACGENDCIDEHREGGEQVENQ
jgi:hypothetical protein